MNGVLAAAARLLLVFGWTFLLLPVQIIAVALRRPLAERIPMLYHRGFCRLAGIAIEQRGEMSPARPTLFVSNHVSYLDISVLGAVIPGSFVSRHDVADWPLVGLLAKLHRSVFIERRSRNTRAQRDAISDRLGRGDNLILFPEGTSSDGNRMLPFKSALFSAAEGRAGDAAPIVQPVSLAYTTLAGLPLTRHHRPFVAWYGDMELAGHFWNFLRLGRVTVVVWFHPPVTIDRFGSRKALANHCQETIAEGVSGSHDGGALAAAAR